jgi:hypothetical protein
VDSASDCPICYEPLGYAKAALTWCAACGNNLHGECMAHWAQSKRASGERVTCPLCRTKWADPDKLAPPGAAGKKGNGGAAAASRVDGVTVARDANGYLNLGGRPQARRRRRAYYDYNGDGGYDDDDDEDEEEEDEDGEEEESSESEESSGGEWEDGW